jgi:hypothetical protein
MVSAIAMAAEAGNTLTAAAQQAPMHVQVW